LRVMRYFSLKTLAGGSGDYMRIGLVEETPASAESIREIRAIRGLKRVIRG